MTTQRTHIGTRLKLARLSKNINLTELERKSGVSRSMLSRIERNRRVPQLDHFVAIITVLQITPHEMLCGSTDWNPGGVAI